MLDHFTQDGSFKCNLKVVTKHIKKRNFSKKKKERKPWEILRTAFKLRKSLTFSLNVYSGLEKSIIHYFQLRLQINTVKHSVFSHHERFMIFPKS